MATVEQIHERGREAFKRITDSSTSEWAREWGLRCQQVLMLEEIAAQLAELNNTLYRVTGNDQWGNVALFTQSAEARSAQEGIKE